MTYLRVPPTLEGEPDPGRIARLIFGVADWKRRQPAEQVVDLGEIWQGLHYLITGDPWDGKLPESDIVCGGRLLTEDGSTEQGMDVIYLTPERVKAAADHLEATPFASRRFDVQTMIEVGIQGATGWSAETRDSVLRPAFDTVSAFFAAAAAESQAIYKIMG